MNEENILGIIQDHENEINEIRNELGRVEELGLDMPEVVKAANNRLAFLYDNKYRCEMLAKAWKLL